jgi:hypothetical protein
MDGLKEETPGGDSVQDIQEAAEGHVAPPLPAVVPSGFSARERCVDVF